MRWTTIGVTPETSKRVGRMADRLTYLTGEKVSKEDVILAGLWLLERMSFDKLVEVIRRVKK